MGAESSLLQNVTIGDSVHDNEKRGWSLHRARQTDGSRVSAFVYEIQPKSSSGERLENLVKHLKTIRHPTIVKFLAYGKHSGNHVLVTEPVQALSQVIEGLSPFEICAGMYNIVEAISFLHDAAGVSHNNICMSSVFVGNDGAWKLGGMECACSLSTLSPDFIERCTPSRDDASIPPEDKVKPGTKSQAQPPHARDAFGFGVLADQLMEYLVELGTMTKSFDEKIQALTDDDPSSRPNLQTLLQDKLFKNDFMEIARFLRNITLKQEDEKEKFFINLVPRLLQLSADLVATRLATPLLSRFVLLEESANKYLIPHLLTSCKVRNSIYQEGEFNAILPDKLFRLHIIPELYKIFHVRDAHIRLVLLRNFANFAHMFDKETLQSVIMPQLLVGLRDQNDEIVELSLRALADLVPVIGGDIIVGGPRVKYFSEGKPKFPHHPSLKMNHHERRRHTTPNGRCWSSPEHHVKRSPESDDRRRKLSPRERRERRTRGQGQLKKKRSEESPPRDDEGTSPVVEDCVNGACGGEDQWSDWESPTEHGPHETEDCDLIQNSGSEHSPCDGNSCDSSVINKDFGTPPEHTPSHSHSGSPAPPIGRGLKIKTSKKTEANCDVQNDLNSSDKETANSSQINSEKGSAQSSPFRRKVEALGAEYDVMAIDVKRKESKDEIDELFADMQPKIKTESLDLLSMLAKAEESQRQMDEKQMERMKEESKVHLAYKSGDHTEEDTGAWDDDDIVWADTSTEETK